MREQPVPPNCGPDHLAEEFRLGFARRRKLLPSERRHFGKGGVAEAFTVGNPDTYELAVDRQDCVKQAGGVVYLFEIDAHLALENGYLPRRWVEGRKVRGHVYRLELPAPFVECTRVVNALRILTKPARVYRL